MKHYTIKTFFTVSLLALLGMSTVKIQADIGTNMHCYEMCVLSGSILEKLIERSKNKLPQIVELIPNEIVTPAKLLACLHCFAPKLGGSSEKVISAKSMISLSVVVAILIALSRNQIDPFVEEQVRRYLNYLNNGIVAFAVINTLALLLMRTFLCSEESFVCRANDYWLTSFISHPVTDYFELCNPDYCRDK